MVDEKRRSITDRIIAGGIRRATDDIEARWGRPERGIRIDDIAAVDFGTDRFPEIRSIADRIRGQFADGSRVRIRFTDGNGTERIEEFVIGSRTGRIERVFVDGKVADVVERGVVSMFDDNPAKVFFFNADKPFAGFPVGEHNYSVGFAPTRGEDMYSDDTPTFSDWARERLRETYQRIGDEKSKSLYPLQAGDVKTSQVTVTQIDTDAGSTWQDESGKTLVPVGYVDAVEVHDVIDDLWGQLKSARAGIETITQQVRDVRSDVEEARKRIESLESTNRDLLSELYDTNNKLIEVKKQRAWFRRLLKCDGPLFEQVKKAEERWKKAAKRRAAKK